MLGREKTIIVVCCKPPERGQWFRVTLPAAHQVENNLRLANMDFAEFAGLCVDGVFRGF